MRFERVDDRALRRLALHVDGHFLADVRERSEVRRKDDSNHSVCTSTDNTAGRF